MGHHIDTKLLGEEVYMPYLSCISKNYSNALVTTDKLIKMCKKKKKSKDECDLDVVRQHARELIADQWAIKFLGIYARTNNYTVFQIDSLPTYNHTGACGMESEGIHPSGNFRIGTLLRNNPDISDLLSCDNSKIKKPACTFDGEVNL